MIGWKETGRGGREEGCGQPIREVFEEVECTTSHSINEEPDIMGRSRGGVSKRWKILEEKRNLVFFCPEKKPMRLEPSEEKGEYCDIWPMVEKENRVHII